MSAIERTIEVRFRHQVHFTRNAFAHENRLVRDVLCAGDAHGPRKVLVILAGVPVTG